jgi:hypothetical protein
MEKVGDLGLRDTLDLLKQKTDLTEGPTGGSFLDEPEAVSVLGIALELAGEPGIGLGTGQGLRIEAHDLGIGEHFREELEIRRNELAKGETRGFSDDVHDFGRTVASAASAASPLPAGLGRMGSVRASSASHLD